MFGIFAGVAGALGGVWLVFFVIACVAQVGMTLSHIKQPLGRTADQKGASGTFLGIVLVELVYYVLASAKLL